jgi:1-acyl-sn-glycerol-3-phosphate acyltransferase
MIRITGVRLQIEGKEKITKERAYVIIANHQSHFDALAIVLTLGIQFRWIAKKELLKVPLFGQALYASRNIFIDRSDQTRAIESLKKGLKRLPQGVSLFFFAEGSRSQNGTIQPFKKGGFISAIESSLPVLPVIVKGSRNILPKKSLVFHSGTIKVIVADPIETEMYSLEDVEYLTKHTRDIIISHHAQ